MDSTTLVLASLTAVLAIVTFQAWRLGNEQRDLALLGVLSGLMGTGAAASTLF